MKRILVVGANGFIGQHLCKNFVESGNSVIAWVRNGADPGGLQSLGRSLKICKASSLCDSEELDRALIDVEVVVHLAGRAHVMTETAWDPLGEFRRANVETTEMLAKMAGRRRVKRFIYISTVKVNGEFTTATPFGADDPPGYIDPYGQSKWEAEVSLQRIAEDQGMEWVVIRPPLVYGPGAKGNFLSLAKSVLRGALLPVGSIRNQRSLISVFNLVSFISAASNHPRAANNRFVTADRDDISTPELVRHMGIALGRPARIVPCPEVVLRTAGAILGKRSVIQRLCSSLVLDRQKARTLLDWSAPNTLEWGLDRTAEWFRQPELYKEKAQVL